MKDDFWILAIVATLAGIFLLIAGITSCTDEKEEPQYRIEVIDKYETIGSSWHLIGGRASETEYHIIYKVTPLNEEARRVFFGNKSDVEVNYIEYKDANIGKTYVDKEYPLF